MLSAREKAKAVRVGLVVAIAFSLALSIAGCGGGARKAPGDLEAAIIRALRSTPYGQGGSESIWAWATMWAGASSADSSDVTWTVESKDPDRIVWTVTILVPSTQLSSSGKQSGLQEGPRFLVDLEDWVAELDLNSPGSQIMWQGMQSLGYMVSRWNLVGTPPPVP